MNTTDTLPRLRAAADQLKTAQEEVTTAIRHLHFAENMYRTQFQQALQDTEHLAQAGGTMSHTIPPLARIGTVDAAHAFDFHLNA